MANRVVPKRRSRRPRKNLLGNIRREIGARSRAAVALTHHPPVDPSALASASVTRAKIEGFSSIPPTISSSACKEPAIDQGFDDGFGEFPDFVVFRPQPRRSGREISRFLSCGWTVGMVCLLLRDSAARLITTAGRSGQAMARTAKVRTRRSRGDHQQSYDYHGRRGRGSATMDRLCQASASST